MALRVTEFEKDGETKYSTRLTGIGYGEEVKFTLKMDFIWESKIPKTIERNGKNITFKPMGLAIEYEGKEMWLNLTENQGKFLKNVGLEKGKEVTAYIPEGERYVAFTTGDSPSPAPTPLNIETPTKVVTNEGCTEDEERIIKECVNVGLEIDYVRKNLIKFKEEGMKIGSTDFERIESLMEKFGGK